MRTQKYNELSHCLSRQVSPVWSLFQPLRLLQLILESKTVKYEDGSKRRINNKDVWGFIQDGRLYRRYRRDFLEVVSQRDLIEYKSRTIPQWDVITKSTHMVERPHVFSKTLDSKLHPSAKAALKGD